jgi:hypothetical protein
MNPVVAKVIRADGTELELTGSVVDWNGMVAVNFDQAVPVMEGDVIHMAPIIRAVPPTTTAH